mgnify:CR=1 FL=1
MKSSKKSEKNLDEKSSLLPNGRTPVYPRQTGVNYENVEKAKKSDENTLQKNTVKK